MASERGTVTEVTAPVFPVAEVKRRLQEEVQNIAAEAAILHPESEPLLDSRRVVGTVLVLEGLFRFKIPPDKVVRKGGYDSVEEAINDMLVRIEKIWEEHSKPRVRK